VSGSGLAQIGPGAGAAVGPGQGRYGLRGLSDGDLEAEGLDLLDVVADLAVGVDPGGVVAGAQVDVPGGRVSEQVQDDDQDGPGGGGLDLRRAAATGDRAVAARIFNAASASARRLPPQIAPLCPRLSRGDKNRSRFPPKVEKLQ